VAKSELAIRDGWFPRILRALRLVEVKPDGSTTHSAGSDFIGDDPGVRTYSALNSMAAMARFPWVRACVEAVSSDLTKIKTTIVKGRGKDAETIEDHPFFDLMDRPNSRTPGILFARQLVVDLLLTGDAFALIAGEGEPRALIRLHPERVKIVPNDDGQIKEYEYTGAGSSVRYGYEQVLHFRSPSWQSNPSMLYGSGAIESLHNDLTTDLAASELAAKSAQTGLPTGIISPAESGDIWTRPQITQLREGFEKQLKAKSGTVILGAGVTYKQLSHSLRDLEYQETRKLAKEAVMAALGVVPVRVGVESANYASSRQQMRLYWEQLQGRAALMDSEWTRLLRMFPDSEGLRVVSDFSEVESLQESRTERVNRVNQWWLMGVSLQEAAALEGFENLNADEIAAEPEPAEADAEQVARWLIYDNDDPATARAVGDTDPTNFPADGDDETVSLSESRFDVFDVEFAEMIKLKYPQIWRAGGNVKGNEQFRKLRPIALAGGGVDTRSEEEAVRLREAWAARHFEDYRLAGVVAQMKWLVVGSRGERYMKDLIIDEMDKIDQSKAAKWLSGEAHTVDLETDDGRAIAWRAFIDKVHTPHERRIALSMRRYLRAQAARIAKRLKDELGNKSVTKAIDPVVLDRVLDEAFERQQLLDLFRPLYRQALADAFEEASRNINSDLLFEPAQLEREAVAAVRQMETSILSTTRTDVGRLVNALISQGVTLPEMQSQIVQSSSFSPQRAMTIARTETTRVANHAANEAYTRAEESGIKVEKMWLSARDNAVRDTHRDLDGQTIPSKAKFEIGGATADAPGGFGTGALDINCRCTMIGKVAT
jgi:HK97 family phage portal protein